MLDLSPDKLFMLAIVAVVILGPNRLPGAARSLGRFVAQMRSMSSSLQSEVREALSDHEGAFTAALTEFRPGDVRRSVRNAVTSTLTPAAETPRPAAPSLPEAPAPAAPAWEGRTNPDDPTLN